MSRIIRHPWTKQPQVAALDRGHPLARKLVFASIGGIELVEGVKPTGSSGRIVRPDGGFARFDGSTQSLLYDTGTVFNTSGDGVTIMMRTVQPSPSPAYAVYSRFRMGASDGFIVFSTSVAGGGDANYYRYAAGSGSGAGPGIRWGPASARALNSVDTIALQYDDSSGFGWASNSSWRGFENGAFYSCDTNPGLSPVTVETRLGDHSVFPTASEIHYAYVWRRRLSDAEIQALYQNPWQIFQPLTPRKFFLPTASAGGATNLVLADALHAHAADAMVLSTLQPLVLADALHAHSADTLALTTQLALALADATHTQGAENLSLLTGTALAPADAVHAHTADSLALSVLSILSVQDTAQAHAVDNLVLTSAHALTLADALHSHSVDNLALSTDGSLVVADATQAHAVDNLVLTVAVSLTTADAVHAHSAENLTLLAGLALAPTDVTHAHTVDSVELTAAVSLALSDALHMQLADALVLSNDLSLAVADALQAHFGDGLVLLAGSLLTVADALHTHTVDATALSVQAWLAVADALHAHRVESVTLLLPTLLLVDRVSGIRLAGAILTVSLAGATISARLKE